MNHTSLSSFMRNGADNHFDGPIPAETKDRIRIVESAERAFERSLTKAERAERGVRIAVDGLLADLAKLEARRECAAEDRIMLETHKGAGGSEFLVKTLGHMAEKSAARSAEQLAVAIDQAKWARDMLTSLVEALEAEQTPPEPNKEAA